MGEEQKNEQGRPTVEVKTSSGHELVLNEYITAREKRAISNVYLENVNVSGAGGIPEMQAGINPETVNKAQDLALKFVIVSLDGSRDDIVERILELPSEEAQEIMDEVDGRTNKKKSNGNSLSTPPENTET